MSKATLKVNPLSPKLKSQASLLKKQDEQINELTYNESLLQSKLSDNKKSVHDLKRENQKLHKEIAKYEFSSNSEC